MARFSLLRRAGCAGVVAAALAAGPIGAGPGLAAEAEPEGTVSGRVTDAQTGEPLAGICVEVAARDFSGASGAGCTDEGGDYTTSPLPPGDYVVRFLDQSGTGYLGEHYDNQSERALAQTVAVGEGVDTAGIDAALTLGGRITGTISSDAGPAGDQCVYAYPAGADDWVRSGCTDESGAYMINRLPAGAYDLRIDGGADYQAVWYGGTADRATATRVSVELGQTASGVDQVMADGGRLSGTVRDAETGEPLVYEDFCVHVFSDATEVRTVCPWASGDWQVLGLSAGTYTVKFTADGYATQWWEGRSSLSGATPLVLEAGERRTGVDASLARPVDTGTAPGTVERWAGADRFASSATFSAKSFAPGVDVAYIASGLNFPDALSAAPIAGKGGDPILLTKPTSLPGPIATELKRLKPKKIVVLGSEGVISRSVATTLKGYTTGTVERWAGADRFASSAIFSAKSFAAGVDVAYISSGENFPDALSAAPIAGKGGDPILLTRATSLPGSIATELKRLKPKKIVVLGSEGVISKSVATTLKGYTTGTVERWAGTDRFASSAIFSAKSFTAGVDTIYISSGENFPDALSAAPIAGRGGSPILLTKTTSLPGPIATELGRLKPRNIVVLGSEGVISKTVADQLKGYLG